MSRKTIRVSKRPELITTFPSEQAYTNLSQSELLSKVKLLHEQLLMTNQYLMDVHKISIYNWEDGDTGNIMVTLPESQKGFLLDSVIRLRGTWNPVENSPVLVAHDETKIGWIYKVVANAPVLRFDKAWKTGDYALYDEQGNLYNVQNDMLASLFTPIILMESNSIQFDPLPQSSDEGLQIRANVKLDPEGDNDITVNARGLYSNAYQKAKALITVQETAPTEDNLEGGLRIVYLPEPPEIFYNGYLYLIPPASIDVPN